MDAVVASGMEAGGHRVSFLRPAEESLVGTFALVPQVVDAVDVPVIAAGGIADARGVAAALVLGASGAMIGTAFLATDQSGTSAAHRDALRSDAARETVLTRAMSGRLARGIPNRATREIADPAPFPLQNWLTGLFRARAAELGRAELLSLWAGQAAAIARQRDAAALLRELAAGVDALLLRLIAARHPAGGASPVASLASNPRRVSPWVMRSSAPPAPCSVSPRSSPSSRGACRTRSRAPPTTAATCRP